MSDKSLEKRVTVLEAMMGDKTLEEHFREHAELIDRRFAEVHARFAEIHARFTAQDKRFEAMDERFNRVDHELGMIRRDVGTILAKLTDIGTRLPAS